MENDFSKNILSKNATKLIVNIKFNFFNEIRCMYEFI